MGAAHRINEAPIPKGILDLLSQDTKRRYLFPKQTSKKIPSVVQEDTEKTIVQKYA